MAKYLVIILIFLNFNPLAASAQVVSYKRLQYLDTVAQTTEYSCGAAAIATLMNQYGIETSESEVLTLARQVEENMEAFGMNITTIEKVLQAYGIKTLSSKRPISFVINYFKKNQTSLPLIMHLGESRKRGHYIVAMAMFDRWLVIADPYTGVKVIDESELAALGFEGVVIIPDTPPQPLILNAAEQRKNLVNWAESRLRRLGN